VARPILAASSWSGGVSFSGVLRHVLAALGDRPIVLLALELEGEPWREGNVTVVPARCDGYGDRQAGHLWQLADRLRPAAVFYFFDHFAAQHHYPALVAIQRRLAPVVTYVPVDGTLVDARPLAALTAFERVVFYTRDARRRFLDLDAAQRGEEARGELEPRIRAIAHGVDRDRFSPLPEGPAAAKRAAFPDRPDLHGKTFILNANRPWERKRLDLTLEGFARAVHRGHDAALYLHLPGGEEEDRAKLEQAARQLGVGDRVVLGSGERLPIEELNRLYNACEIGLNTAMGEGWGLVSCEHATSGAAQVVPDDGTFRDVWGDAAVYAATPGRYRHWACPHVEYRVVDAESVAAALAGLLADPVRLRERSEAAAARMRQPRFDWREIELRWGELFAEVTARGEEASAAAGTARMSG